jgi:pyruvate-formate lyase
MKTAMQELIEEMEYCYKDHNIFLKSPIEKAKKLLEKEKKQIQKAFSDGQETPINHPTLPHYSRDEYYDDNYNS